MHHAFSPTSLKRYTKEVGGFTQVLEKIEKIFAAMITAQEKRNDPLFLYQSRLK